MLLKTLLTVPRGLLDFNMATAGEQTLAHSELEQSLIRSL